MAPVSELPILARIGEAEAIVSLIDETLIGAIESFVGTEAASTDPIGENPCFEITVAVGAPENSANRVLQAVCFALQGLIGDAALAAGDLLVRAGDSLDNVMTGIVDLTNKLQSSVVGAIEGIVATAQSQLKQVLATVVNELESVVSSVGGFLGDLIDRINDSVRGVLDAIGFGINALISSVGDAFGALVGTIEVLVERLDRTVRDVGTFFVELATATLENMTLALVAALGPLIGAGESVLERLAALVESVPGALKDAATRVAEGVGEFVGAPLNTLGSILVTQIEEFFAALIEKDSSSHGEILRTLLTRLGAPPDAVEDIASAADEASGTSAVFLSAALAFLIPLIIAQFAGAALEPLAIQTQQKISSAVRQTLIAPGDLLDGLFKGDIPESRVSEDFEQAGYTEERVVDLIATFRRAPDISVSLQGWLRGLIDEAELDTVLASNRLRADDAALLKKVVFFVPPAQDLIQMAVREVFSPEIRERFGQDEDFPPEFATFAAQVGISDEWARAYWAAHWALPSPAQGFEMLHRKVIEPADLDVLLRALDVMPFWRDKLTGIACNPLTRVDLRRMHALGLLTDKELQTRYEAIGFNADDAALMVAFTVVFNSSEDELPEELLGLTRASVLNMFEDGLIDRDDAVDLITRMGIGSDAAELYVEQRDIELGRRERNNLIESIIRLAGGGRINLSQAEDSLAQTGISAIEITRAVGRITGLISDRDRLPSLAALEKMHTKAIIDDDVFLSTIKALGFNDEWAKREFLLITGEEPPLPSELEGLTRASILSLFEDGFFSRDETLKALIGIGIGPGAAELLIAQREGDIRNKQA